MNYKYGPSYMVWAAKDTEVVFVEMIQTVSSPKAGVSNTINRINRSMYA